MASWAVIGEQVVWISPLATGFTVVCERCKERFRSSMLAGT